MTKSATNKVEKINGKIWIVLTDDWELRGNGRGTVENLQRIPALRLMELYQKLGIRSTFNLEVMQQIAFVENADKSPEIAKGVKDWNQTVKDMVDGGFDVQLHIHPQWHGAKLQDGWWNLGQKWHLADYSQTEIETIVGHAFGYMEKSFPKLAIKSFRAGSWGFGPPSGDTHFALAKRGICLDMSIVNGLYYRGVSIQLDYRRLESPYQPYFSNRDDVRIRAEDKKDFSGMIEIPTQSVLYHQVNLAVYMEILKGNFAYLVEFIKVNIRILRNHFRLLRNRLHLFRKVRRDSNLPSFVQLDPFGFMSLRSLSFNYILDLSSNYSPLIWRILIKTVIGRAKKVNTNAVQVLILENHTKDLQKDSDFARIEGVIRYIQQNYPDVEFKTIADVIPLVEETKAQWLAGKKEGFPLHISLR